MTGGMRQLAPLIGAWALASRTYPEGRGRLTVAPTEGGRFLRFDAGADDGRFPHSAQLVGADEAREECTALYFDSRDVCRVYQMTVLEGVWTVWRHAPGFNQRFTGTIADGGNRIEGQWEFSEDGSTWKFDFDLTYTRIER